MDEDTDADKEIVGLVCGIAPSATLSATAFATAYCAGPNIWTACFAPLMVTLLNRMLWGLQARFGATTASSEVKPSLLLSVRCRTHVRPRCRADQ